MDAIGNRVDLLAHRIGTLSPCSGVFGLPIDALGPRFPVGACVHSWRVRIACCDVFVDFDVVLAGVGPGMILPHAVNHELLHSEATITTNTAVPPRHDSFPGRSQSTAEARRDDVAFDEPYC